MNEKETKIKALLTGRACELIEKVFGEEATADSYEEFFDVKLKDINEFVKNYGIPQESYKTKPSLQDGHYLISKDGHWCVFYQERNIIFLEKIFDDKEKAVDYLVTLLLSISGTGLVFE